MLNGGAGNPSKRANSPTTCATTGPRSPIRSGPVQPGGLCQKYRKRPCQWSATVVRGTSHTTSPVKTVAISSLTANRTVAAAKRFRRCNSSTTGRFNANTASQVSLSADSQRKSEGLAASHALRGKGASRHRDQSADSAARELTNQSGATCRGATLVRRDSAASAEGGSIDPLIPAIPLGDVTKTL